MPFALWKWFTANRTRRSACPAPASCRPRAALVLEGLEDRLVPSTLIPVNNSRDLVFDQSRHVLYMTTSTGTVQRYDVNANKLLTPWAVGTSLNGADITADDSTLYIGENQTTPGGVQAMVHKVNLANGSVTNLTYAVGEAAPGETGPNDIAIGAQGKALLNGAFDGSGWVPLRQLNLSTGTFSVPASVPGLNEVRGETLVHRSADRRLLFITEGGDSGGNVLTYDAVTNTFSSLFSTNQFLNSVVSAVNRNGSLLAVSEYNVGVAVLDRNFDTVKILPGQSGGLAFDPVRDILYSVNTTTNQIVAYDTNTWAVKYQLDIGEVVDTAAPRGPGVMTVSDDGKLLFLATPLGVRQFNLPTPQPASTQFAVTGFPTPTTAGAAGSFTVTAENALGQPLTHYTGTVHFTSSDPQAVLPANYTFTPADHGVHTFTATLKTAGGQSLTVTDHANAAVTATEGNVYVQPAAVRKLVISGYSSSPVSAGVAQDVTVTARDAYGNSVPTFNDVLHFSSSDRQAALPFDGSFWPPGVGVSTYAVTLNTPGTQSITVTDKAHPALSATATGIAVVPPPKALVITGLPAQVTAGSTVSFTLKAVDAYGNVAVGATGMVDFTGSGGLVATETGGGVAMGEYTFTAADRGAHTFTVTFTSAGIDAVSALGYFPFLDPYTQATVKVMPGPAAALSLDTPLAPLTAGSSRNVTVTARDAYGNVVTDCAGKVHFRSSDPLASLPADYTFTPADQGTHTFPVVLYTVFSPNPPPYGQSITVTTVSAPALTATVYEALVPAAWKGFRIDVPAAVEAGTPFHVTVSAVDAYGNPQPFYVGIVRLSSSDGKAEFLSTYTFRPTDYGRYTFLIPVTLHTLGTQTITATDVASGKSGTMTLSVVAPPAGLHFAVSAPKSVVAGSNFSVTLTALDGSGHPIPNYIGTAGLTTSDPNPLAIRPLSYQFTPADHGVHTFTNVALLLTAGAETITASDPAAGAGAVGAATVQVSAGSFYTLTLTALPAAQFVVGVPQVIVVTARDFYGNVVTNFNQTVKLFSTDPHASLPGVYTFTAGDRGVHEFDVTFGTSGPQTVTIQSTGFPVYYNGLTIAVGAAVRR